MTPDALQNLADKYRLLRELGVTHVEDASRMIDAMVKVCRLECVQNTRAYEELMLLRENIRRQAQA